MKIPKFKYKSKFIKRKEGPVVVRHFCPRCIERAEVVKYHAEPHKFDCLCPNCGIITDGVKSDTLVNCPECGALRYLVAVPTVDGKTMSVCETCYRRLDEYKDEDELADHWMYVRDYDDSDSN